MWRVVRWQPGIRAAVTLMLLLGFAGSWLGLDLEGGPWFYAVLLGVGLFASTFGIDLAAMRRSDWRVVVLAVTVGVLAKAAIIGGLLVWMSGDPKFFILGVAVAQIDPLSVSALAGKSFISKAGDNLLRAWSSLDDPVTVLLVVMLAVIQGAFGLALGVSIANVAADGMAEYGQYLWLNVAFMTFMVWTWQLAYRGTLTWKLVFTASLIACAILVGASWYWMFGLALMGIYLRPEWQLYHKLAGGVDLVTKIAFLIAGVVVGSLLWHSFRFEGFWMDVAWGVALGAAAFVSQMIVAPILTWRGDYTTQDRWYLAFGHQNGLTACMLGLATGTIAIVVPAIVVTHILYAAGNVGLNWRFAAA